VRFFFEHSCSMGWGDDDDFSLVRYFTSGKSVVLYVMMRW